MHRQNWLFICLKQGCERDLRARDETETFGFQSETRPRPRPSQIFPRPRRDRDVWFSVRDETKTKTFPDFPETETFDFVSETRPRRSESRSRDQYVETETTLNIFEVIFELIPVRGISVLLGVLGLGFGNFSEQF